MHRKGDTTYGQIKLKYPELAKKVQRYAPNVNLNTTIGAAFTWMDTVEGGRFWGLVNSGEFSRASKIEPELFKNNLIKLFKKL
jgi:hypothetical protein